MLKTDTAPEKPAFVMPERIEVDEGTLTNTYGKFILQPLERGFGTTLGNGLRRTLLSSIEGAAIEAIHIEGVQHEFTAVPGVVEDVPELILNLKEVRLRLHSEERKTIHVKKTGPSELAAGDLEVESAIEIVNKDHVIATLEEGAELSMDIDIGRGRGFILADDVTADEIPLGTILVDALYSPVQKVNFEVGRARVGQRTDYDSLLLEVWTDGTTHPRTAVAQAARLLRSHLQFFLEEGEAEEEAVPAQREEEQSVLDIRVENLDLSMRSINCLRAAGIAMVEELVKKSENDMLKYRNFGRKSLIELTEKLEQLGLRFGMSDEDIALVRSKGVGAPAETEQKDEEAAS